MWLHLEGAREYAAGIDEGENEGMACYDGDCARARPKSFFDPFSDTMVHMVGELALVLRRTRSRQMILLHTCTGRDGCSYYYFSRMGE